MAEKTKQKTPEKVPTELETWKAQVEEYTDLLKRYKAEFENYVKRTEKERSDFTKYASEKLCLRLLTIVDEFEQALKNISDAETKQGIQMIYDNLSKVLKEEGITPITATNTQFDPHKHEVLAKVESDKPDNTVLEEIQKGYMLHDKVIRHAKVKLAKNSKGVQNNE